MAAIPATEGRVKTARVRPAARVERTQGNARRDSEEAERRKASSSAIRGSQGKGVGT